jgi:sugar transferase EpsL
MYKKFGKRLFDLILTLAFLPLALPLVLFISVLQLISGQGKVFFTQLRPGLHGKPFVIYKFATMTNHTDHIGQLLPDRVRITKLGKWLRALSLDELPQLWNVLKGELSFVGPRPLLMEYLPLYTPEQQQRHAVKPGITGWAQVNGRNATTWPDRLAQDVWYAQHLSFSLDLRILLMTIKKVLRSEGISAEGEATMKKFTGT